MSRERFLDAGPVRARGPRLVGLGAGRSASRSSADGGATWADAELERDAGSPWAWRALVLRRGTRRRATRARAAARRTPRATQPLEPQWNVGGFGNNAVQRVPVTVR